MSGQFSVSPSGTPGPYEPVRARQPCWEADEGQGEGPVEGGAPESVDPRRLLRHLAPVSVPLPQGSEVRQREEAPRRMPLRPLGVGLSVSLTLFAVLTYLALGVDAGVVDRPALDEAVRHRAAPWDGPMTVVSQASEGPLLAVALLAALWLSWRRGSWLPLALVGATGTLAVAMATVAKEVTDRTRPPARLWAVHEDGFCFPSRHTVIATAVLLVLAYVAAAGIASRAGRAALWAGALLLCLAAGASRLYLGVHWPTDVAAGLALGVAAALVVLTGYAACAARSPSRGGHEGPAPGAPPE